MAATLAAAALSPWQPIATQAATVPSLDHFFVIVMENHGYNQVIGSSAAPYVNSLLSTHGLATNYYAVSHPSLPNYLALTGGTTYGIASDCTTCFIAATNVADNLEATHSSWKAYEESMPSPCFVGDSYPYAQKHDPFIYFDDIRTNTARCQAHVVPYSQMAGDLASTSTTPNYAFITPNMCNDMHDCSVATGDAWLQAQVPVILNSPAFKTQNSVLAITWDEDDSSGTNQVATILLGGSVPAGARSSTTYNHYSLLRTIESALSLPAITSNDGSATPMADLLNQSAPAPSPLACTGVTLNSSPVQPVMSGTPVTFSAIATGCSNPSFEFWMRPASQTTWQLLQRYGVGASYSWNSTGASGTVYFGVWARDASSSAAYDTYASGPFEVNTASCSSPTVSATPASLMSGTHVTVTASTAGCSSGARYEFWLRPETSSIWQMVQGYSTSATYSWNSTGALAGTVYLGVWVRDAGSAAAYDAVASTPVTVTTPSCASVSVSANPGSVVQSNTAGTHVTVTAGASGCSSNPEYEFWIRPATSSTWQMVQAYGSGSTYSWNSTGALPGTVYLGVWARDATGTAAYDAVASVPVSVT